MSPFSSPLRSLFVCALVLALAGDLLLRVAPWGLNAPVFIALLLLGLGYISLRFRSPLPREAWPILVAGMLCASFIGVRDSEELMVWNILATLVALHVGSGGTRSGELLRMSFLGHLRHGLLHILHVATGMGFLLLRDLRTEHPEKDRDSRLSRLARGVVMAIPALLVFGALLMSADASFEYLVTDVLSFDLGTALGHLALFSVLAWMITGWLRGRVMPSEFDFSLHLFTRRFSLGLTEIVILLGSLDLLFTVFVFLQMPHFFGGHEFVQSTTAVTYASYARRGFFELIAVAALSLPLLLTSDWLLDVKTPRHRRIFSLLSLIMLLLLDIMLGSALHRLLVYMDAYGLTASRLHALAILVWIATTLLLFCATVLRERRVLFPYAILLSGYLVLIGLNVANPEALVARVNLSRIKENPRFDVRSTLRLGADATAPLLEALPGLPAEPRSVLAEGLLRLKSNLAWDGDPRTWNHARMQAGALLDANHQSLRGFVLPRPVAPTPHNTMPLDSISSTAHPVPSSSPGASRVPESRYP